METPLFRDEVVQARRAQYLGSIRIGHRASFMLMALASVAIVAAAVSYARWGQVAHRVRLNGLLVPTLGAVDLISSQAGILTEIRVREGESVRAGQVLAKVGTDRASAQGATAELVARSLQQRRASLIAEMELAQRQARLREQALAGQLSAAETEHEHALAEVEALEHRVDLAGRSVERFQALARDGFVADLKAQEQQEQAIDFGIRLRQARRNLAALEREMQSLKAQRTAEGGVLQQQLSQLDRALASLDQEVVENGARGNLILAAPRDGIVASLNFRSGQAIQAGQAVLSLLPEDMPGKAGLLEAHLYAPSRTTGFVRAGQKVWLRYAAYPYQKFGLEPGHIAGVSRSPINTQDLPSGQVQVMLQAVKSSEPLYRVTVALEHQLMRAQGQDHPLKPGMVLEADVLLERRAVWEWLLEPLLTIAAAIRRTSAGDGPDGHCEGAVTHIDGCRSDSGSRAAEVPPPLRHITTGERHAAIERP